MIICSLIAFCLLVDLDLPVSETCSARGPNMIKPRASQNWARAEKSAHGQKNRLKGRFSALRSTGTNGTSNYAVGGPVIMFTRWLLVPWPMALILGFEMWPWEREREREGEGGRKRVHRSPAATRIRDATFLRFPRLTVAFLRFLFRFSSSPSRSSSWFNSSRSHAHTIDTP